MLVYFKKKIVSLDWLDMKMSNQFFIDFINNLEKLEFTVASVVEVSKIESQRNYFSDGFFNTLIEMEIKTFVEHIDVNMGTAILFLKDKAYLFEDTCVDKSYSIQSNSNIRVPSIVTLRATNYVLLTNNQFKVLENYVETYKIDTSILTFDSTSNFFEK